MAYRFPLLIHKVYTMPNTSGYNRTKFLILHKLSFGERCTAKEISEWANLPVVNIRKAISHYNTFGKKYLIRSKIEGGRGYTYGLSNYGKKIFDGLYDLYIQGQPLKLQTTTRSDSTLSRLTRGRLR